MSIYSCATETDLILKNGIPIGKVKNAFHFRPLTLEEASFLEDFRSRLKLLDTYKNKELFRNEVDILITHLRDYTEKHPGSDLNPYLNYFVKDLNIVKMPRRPTLVDAYDAKPEQSPIVQTLSEQYKKLLHSSFLKLKLNQAKINEMGLSQGECYGFVLSMADSHLSPYKNKDIQEIEYNESIYNYFQNQTNREIDQGRIKKTRHTIKTYCPSLQDQAEKLYNIAAKNEGEDFLVILHSKAGPHSVYLSVQKEDKKIRFSDPNHGVFLFDNEQQFIAAYQVMYQYHNNLNADLTYHYFEVSRLREDKNNALSESKTFAGKWRSLLAGEKYTPNQSSLTQIMHVILGGSAGIAAGAALGSIIPIFGTIVGAIVGGILGGVFGGYAALKITQEAKSRGHYGLLATYHLLRDELHDLSESVKKRYGIQRECEKIPQFIPPQEESYTRIMRQNSFKTMHSEPDLHSNTSLNQSKQSIAEEHKYIPEDGATHDCPPKEMKALHAEADNEYPQPSYK